MCQVARIPICTPLVLRGVHQPIQYASDTTYAKMEGGRKSLELPDDGPFPVVSCSTKFFTVTVKGKDNTVSVERIKPAFVSHAPAVSSMLDCLHSVCNDTPTQSSDSASPQLKVHFAT